MIRGYKQLLLQSTADPLFLAAMILYNRRIQATAELGRAARQYSSQDPTPSDNLAVERAEVELTP